MNQIWRTIRTPLTLIAMLGLLGYGAYWGYAQVMSPPEPPPPTPCVTQKVPKGGVKSSQVTVRVFNGGSKRGLAGDVAAALRARDFKVTTTANTDETVEQTIIVGADADNPEVKLVQGFFKKATVRADGRSDRSVDVLVGDSYGGFEGKAKRSIEIKADTVCLPSAPSAVPTS